MPKWQGSFAFLGLFAPLGEFRNEGLQFNSMRYFGEEVEAVLCFDFLSKSLIGRLKKSVSFSGFLTQNPCCNWDYLSGTSSSTGILWTLVSSTHSDGSEHLKPVACSRKLILHFHLLNWL